MTIWRTAMKFDAYIHVFSWRFYHSTCWWQQTSFMLLPRREKFKSDDLKDACYHFPPFVLHHRRFLHFAFQDCHFQSLPTLFPRCIAAGLLCLSMIQIQPYLDNWLVCAPSWLLNPVRVSHPILLFWTWSLWPVHRFSIIRSNFNSSKCEFMTKYLWN